MIRAVDNYRPYDNLLHKIGRLFGTSNASLAAQISFICETSDVYRVAVRTPLHIFPNLSAGFNRRRFIVLFK